MLRGEKKKHGWRTTLPSPKLLNGPCVPYSLGWISSKMSLYSLCVGITWVTARHAFLIPTVYALYSSSFFHIKVPENGENRVSVFFWAVLISSERTGLKLALCDVCVWKLHVVEIGLASTHYSLSQQELSLFLALSSDKCHSSQHSQHPPSIDKTNHFDAYTIS